MGQKINAHGVRIGINRGWRSTWYVPKDRYGDTIINDEKIRNYLTKELKSAGIGSIEIKRYSNKVEVEIKVARPGVVIGRGGTQIEIIKEKINKISNSKVNLKVLEMKTPDMSARIIADKVAEQLERRIVPKFAMSNEIEKASATGRVKGVRIWVSGRIKGVEIARTEKAQWGTIPLQTLGAEIDYAFTDVQVPNAGKQGIKVWVYRKK